VTKFVNVTKIIWPDNSWTLL